ncbi:MAG: FMN-binding protein, partial [Desulfamplus sp.]|nr:FMN-binding protein [Desulfamplus sp.]
SGVKFVKAYIIPVESRGLWGKIYGYLAFENDGVTIAGFTVYSHAETPGLGGEIEKAWFQKNFVGKKIVDSANDFVSIAIAKGQVSNLPEEEQQNYVDGISGATLTGKYLTQGLKENLEQYEAVSVKFRQAKQLE